MALTFTWTIELGVSADKDKVDGAILQVSPLFSVDRLDFRLVAAASKRSSVGLYLEHFPQPSSRSPAAVPSVRCRLQWSQAASGNGGEMTFDHTFDDPLSSSMLAGKADLIPMFSSNSASCGRADGGDVHVKATVTVFGVHFPGATERAAVESAAWERLVWQLDQTWASDPNNKDEQH